MSVAEVLSYDSLILAHPLFRYIWFVETHDRYVAVFHCSHYLVEFVRWIF